MNANLRTTQIGAPSLPIDKRQPDDRPVRLDFDDERLVVITDVNDPKFEGVVSSTYNPLAGPIFVAGKEPVKEYARRLSLYEWDKNNPNLPVKVPCTGSESNPYKTYTPAEALRAALGLLGVKNTESPVPTSEQLGWAKSFLDQMSV